ncbi:TRPM SLOG domain-containing protein [Caenorhabditis elegans]|uniref:GTL-1 n=2 Tax=Caenorhabditis elegans TaxID=6239 RepID=G5ECM4_CAEEL|nr:TRPM SLOG domain-containing protein [Caenorhabditis elegans]AAU25950.1 GTL-1 [Caenorhabditis elegans]CAA92726.2 TRPM SLOG domain-containing protein [Caenorhabditis elegans]|eukprot:NP_502111.3 Gon-Two Like (TRP subfamily) [Caenorhabditis elegans]
MDRKRGSIVPAIHKAVAESLRANSVTVEENESERETETQTKRRRKKQRSTSSDKAPLNSAPRHVQKFDWKDMLHLADISGRKRGNSTTSHSGHATRAGSLKGKNWIECRLKMRQCSYFVPSQRFSERCGCGKERSKHTEEVLERSQNKNHPLNHLTLPGIHEVDTTDADADDNEVNLTPGRWSIQSHTEIVPTDAYGNIVFEGTAHHAQYARISFDSDPRDIVHLMMKVWKLKPPKLIITINGGLTKFDLQPKLARTFRKGIMKIAKSTDAWIITSGLDEGVVKHLDSALHDHGNHTSKNHVVAIGIASWGMLKQRSRFVGKDSTVTYATNVFNNTRLKELNDNHSYFLFSDNGTVNRYGAEIIMRKRLEAYLAQGDKKRSAIPLVCVVLEGGAFTIKMVHDYVTTIPRIPVIVCDGSGRAADILAFAHQAVSQNGFLSDNIRNQLVNIVRRIFGYDPKTAQKLIKQIVECSTNKSLMTIFRLGESSREDLDHVIMSCLLKGQNLSPPEQLQLALAWNRADIARTEIFANGTEWTTQDLHNAMIEALSNDRIDFVHLLLENGVSMQKFLTYGRLEHLYNTDKGPQNTLRTNLLVDSKHHIKLVEVGRLVENLMGNLYKSNYTKEEFKNQYFLFNNRKQFGKRVHSNSNGGRNDVIGPSGDAGRERMSSMQISLINNARNSIISLFNGGGRKRESDDEDDFSNLEEEANMDFTFRYPYSDLMIWAVLTKRQKMAKLMWTHGEEGMAKALVASRLYVSLAKTASLATGEIGMSQDFTEFSDEFSELAVEVLEYCTKHGRDQTLRLLTCELANWGDETCLSLAANNGHRKFLAHPCCQMLLSDLWQGGLLMKNNQNSKVLTCLAAPPLIFLLGFKTKEQLMLQPKTAAEHDEEMSDSEMNSAEDTDTSSDSSSDSDDSDEEDAKLRAQSLSADQPLSIHRLVRDKLNFSEKKKPDMGISRIVVAPPIVTGRNRARTMSIKKSKKNVIKPPACLKIETSDDDEQEQKKATEMYINRTGKRGSVAVAMNHDDMYIDPSEELDTQTRQKSSREFSSSRNVTVQVYTQRPLSWKKKIMEFYKAPITTYWLWFFAFIWFLILLTYNLLVKTQRIASWSEWYVFAYIFVWTLEIGRKVVSTIMMDTSKPVLKQLRVFFFQYRNGLLAFGLLTYLIAYFIRLSPTTKTLGRILIICNSVIWSLKLVDYLSVQQGLGPYINIVAEMIPTMIPLCVLVFITLYAFGLLRQSITYPYEDWHWILVRNIFLQPYFMLYGEVYAAEIDTCGDEIWQTHEDENIPISMLNVTHETCVPGYWIAPVGLTVFMLATNVLLMNVMVAGCTYIFEKHIQSTREIFLFERYGQVMEYESTPWLPPPFTIIYHVIWLFKLIKSSSRMFERKNLFDQSLKLFLSPDEMEKVHTFEEESVEDMKRETEKKNLSSNDERIHRTAERTDAILNRVSHLTQLEFTLKEEIRELEHKMKNMDSRHKEQMNLMLDMNKKLGKFISGKYKRGSFGGSGSDGGGGSSDNSKLEPNNSVPMITVDGPSPIGSRRTSGQYLKRDSLQAKKKITENRRSSLEQPKIPSIQFNLMEDQDESAAESATEEVSISIPVPQMRVRQVTESDKSDLSEDDLITREDAPPTSINLPRGPRRHALYSTIADAIETEDDFYADSPVPMPMTPVQPADGSFFGENDSRYQRDDSDYE